MTNLNRITLLGHLGREPKSATTQAGKPVTRFSVATNKRYQDQDAETRQFTEWHNCVVFGPAAVYASKLTSGAFVFIEGEMTYREYQREVETPEGPVSVSWLVAEVLVSSISAIARKGNQEKQGSAA